MKEKTKKSFFFEDYTESEILFSNKKSNIRVLRNRINFLFFIFISLAFIFCIKIFHLSLYPAKDFSEKSNKNFISARSDITDRNGIILARNVDIFSAGIRPNLVNDKKKLLLNLKIIFPDIDVKEIKKKLDKNKFFYIKKLNFG